MLTDGYIQGDTDDVWRYTNVRNKPGPNPGTSDDAYMRVEREGGPVPGTKVDANGMVSDGPTVAFMAPDELLSSVPGDAAVSASTLAQAQASLYIKWAGVHPGSLREVLIVWSQDIVLLNRSKIVKVGGGGGDIEAIGIEGRLMTIALSEAIAIDGDEQAVFAFGPGSLGCYITFNGECPTVEEQSQQTVSGGGGSLPSLSSPTGCGCDEPIVGGGGSGGSNDGAAVLDGLLFCTSSCQQNAGEGNPVAAGPGFVINKGFSSVPVRCTYPFMLQPVSIKCGGECEPAPVWLVCYKLFGSTQPMRTVPLAKLLDPVHDLCEWEKNEVYGVLVSDVECGDTTSAQVIGITGTAVTLNGIWRGQLPGYAGQTVQIEYKAENACGETCVNTFTPQETECWVSEDIAKPIRRTIPVTPLRTIGLTGVTIEIPTSIISQTITLPTFVSITTLTRLVNYEYTDLTLLTNIPVNAVWVTSIGSATITGIANVSDVPNVLVGNINSVVTGCAGVNIQVCDEFGDLVSIFVVTECLTAAVSTTTLKDFNTALATVITSIGTTPVTLETITSMIYDVQFEIVPEEVFEFNPTVIKLPEGDPVELEVPVFDDAGAYKFLRLTTSEETEIDMKLLGAPSKAVGTATLRIPLGGCGPKYLCLPEGIESPEVDEGENQNIILFSPLWTRTPMNGESCPCYASCEELPCDAPKSTELFPQMDIAPCTVSVKRLQRNWCKACSVV